MKFRLLFLTILWAGLFSCKSDSPLIPDHEFTMNVHLAKDPQRINPILLSTNAAREVYQYIFLPLAEFNPESLDFEPVLATALPKAEVIVSGEFKGGVSYTFEILDEAKWEDGSDITARDYLFTMKTIMHPQVNAARWRSVLNQVSDIQLYEDKPKKLTVIFQEDYMLSLEACASVELFPEHIYDPANILRSISYRELKALDISVRELGADSTILSFANEFNGVKFSRDVVAGAGAYKLTDWQTDQFIELERKKDWWGFDYPERPLLQAFPSKIVFHIIADEAAAITQLKNGGIDLIKGISAINYIDLQKDETLASQYNFYAPQLMRYYYLGLNNKMPLLDEKNERKALAHLLPIDKIISSLEEGMGSQIVGDFLPARDYYHSDLPYISYDLEKAKELLSQSGWEDSDGDGVRDQVIQGTKRDLKLRIHVSGSKLGNSLALILKESAAPAGLDIEIVQKKFSLIRKENLATGDYDIVTLVKTQSLTHNDPYPSWHTDNAVPGGSNFFGFGDDNSDLIIEEIRSTKNETRRTDLYRQFQELIYEEQPVIFLYSPKEKIVVSNKLEGITSIRRPGYFANTFKRQDS